MRVGPSKIGGSQYDITKMPKAERVKYSFRGKDPLADVPPEALNNIIVV
jgi:hypothetical protein